MERICSFKLFPQMLMNGVISEEAPLPGNSLGFLYRDDGRGPGSTNTGYFSHFRQGTLDHRYF